MKILIIVAALTVSGAGAALAQTLSLPAAKVPAGVGDAGSKVRAAHDAAVASCEQMWDRGTHMSTQEWSRACRRVQNRLKLLDVR